MLQHILFDLDETLYPRGNGLMLAIGHRMEDYISTCLNISHAEAIEIRRRYYQQYGTTLRGLYVEHQINPAHYLAFVHDVPLGNYLQPDSLLRATLTRIPQEKYIFTNSDSNHASRILNALGIADQFTRIFDIHFFELQNKPSLFAYRRVLDALEAQANECALVEDTVRNLEPAHKLGIKTILVDADGEADARIETIYGVADAVEQLDRE